VVANCSSASRHGADRERLATPRRERAHSDKIAEWRTQPAASLQLLTILLMLSVLAVAVASVG
jgi:hypothetical protein